MVTHVMVTRNHNIRNRTSFLKCSSNSDWRSGSPFFYVSHYNFALRHSSTFVMKSSLILTTLRASYRWLGSCGTGAGSAVSVSRIQRIAYPTCHFSIYRRDVKLERKEHLFLGSSSRSLASKNVKKDKGKSKSVQITQEELQEVVDFAEYEASLKNLVEEFKDLLSKQFALRTSSASFESISVEFDGKKQPLNTLVQITFKTPQLVMLNLSGNPNYVPAVVKALEASGLNLSPQVEGHVVYIAVPKVSRDHRENLSKNAKAANNKFRERLRGVQNNFVRTAKNQTDKSEDLVHNVVQKLMERAEFYGKELDVALQAKQKDLLATQ